MTTTSPAGAIGILVLLLAFVLASAGIAAWLGRDANRSKWNGRRDAPSPRAAATIVDLMLVDRELRGPVDDDPTVVLSWPERAARAASMSRHPSTFRPTPTRLEALARSVDEALAVVEDPRALYSFPARTELLPRYVETPDGERLAPYPPVIDNSPTSHDSPDQ